MADHSRAVVTRVEERERESWTDPVRGKVAWYTLFSGDITPTSSMSAGVAELVPGESSLNLHRHEPAELYYILEGTGILTIEGVETVVTAGSAAFIPGNAEHGLRNESGALLRLIYVFPTDRFSDVVYRFGT